MLGIRGTKLSITRPLLAATLTAADLNQLSYPVMGSVKLDGIRCLMHPELGPVTRKFKPVPNDYIRETLMEVCPYGFDGELLVRTPEGYADFNTIQSAVMSKGGEPAFNFIVFDDFTHPDKPYEDRYKALQKIWGYGDLASIAGVVTLLEQHKLQTAEEVQIYAANILEMGHEGIIVRSPTGWYKSGRSTLREGILLKYKEFADAEGVVIGFERFERNLNPQEQDAFGLAKRSSHKAGKVKLAMLGALILETKWGELRVGSGFDLDLRQRIWANQEEWMGATVTFKYQKQGMKGLPRFPIYKGVRYD